MFGNWLKTSILMAGMVALFGAIGMLLGGSGGMMIALALAAALNVWALVFRQNGAQEQHPETAQMMIINPLSAGGLRGLFSTHPATEKRVARLLALAS